MAEWLRRLTRNQMGSSRVGSNPADCVAISATAIAISAKLFWTAAIYLYRTN